MGRSLVLVLALLASACVVDVAPRGGTDPTPGDAGGGGGAEDAISPPPGEDVPAPADPEDAGPAQEDVGGEPDLGGPPDAADAGSPSDASDAAPPTDAGSPDVAADVPDGCVPEPELCNLLDDDCDGVADEREDLLALGFVGIPCGGENACRPGSVECESGEIVCAGIVRPMPEECNGLDDDCDGDTDEEDPGGGEPCGSDEGECRLGTTRCDDERLLCEGEVTAGDERCDGLDNDCDGETDEDFGDLASPCEAGGACGQGSQICNVVGDGTCCSADPACNPAVEVGVELCDGVDNNCDGDTDEGLGLGDPCQGEGICPDGTVECAGPQATRCSTLPGGTAYTGQAESCNGDDDDCDGETDEGAAGVIRLCVDGVGECLRTGRMVCRGGQVVCTAQPGESSPEECNLLDDDCDGDTDEGEDAGPLQRECYSGEPQTRGVGVCRAGVQTCGNGGWSVPCDGEVLPSDEVCNGADDDCNDQTDEAGNCEVCGQECPVAELPEGVLLCVAKPADTAGCPNSFPDDRDVLYAGTARADFTCEECECWTEVTPRYQAAAAGMQQGSCDDLRDRDPWECEDECERQYCSMDMASRAHRATMRLHAAGNELDGECELEDEVAFRLCCTDTLPTRQQCAGPVCPTPRRFLGFVLMGEEGPVTELCGDLGGGAGTVFEDVEPQGFSCGECPCRADLVVRSCVNHWGSGIGDEGGDGDRDPPEPVALGRCDVQRPGGACETPCLTWERAGPNGQQVPVAFSVRHEVEVQGNGAVPDLGAGTCDPVNPMLACDLGGEIIR